MEHRKVIYPPFLDTIALIIGKMRDVYNSEMNEDNPRFKRGNRSSGVNPLGMMGELILMYHLWSKGVGFVATPFLGNGPRKEPDVVVGDLRIDVKTIRTDAPDLLVNERAHLDDKTVNHYCFVRSEKPGEADMWTCPHDEVNSWGVKSVGYSNAYFKPLVEIMNI